MQPAGTVRNSHLRFQISIQYFFVYYKSSRNKLDLIWKSGYRKSSVRQFCNCQMKKNHQKDEDFSEKI